MQLGSLYLRGCIGGAACAAAAGLISVWGTEGPPAGPASCCSDRAPSLAGLARLLQHAETFALHAVIVTMKTGKSVHLMSRKQRSQTTATYKLRLSWASQMQLSEVPTHSPGGWAFIQGRLLFLNQIFFSRLVCRHQCDHHARVHVLHREAMCVVSDKWPAKGVHLNHSSGG